MHAILFFNRLYRSSRLVDMKWLIFCFFLLPWVLLLYYRSELIRPNWLLVSNFFFSSLEGTVSRDRFGFWGHAWSHWSVLGLGLNRETTSIRNPCFLLVSRVWLISSVSALASHWFYPNARGKWPIQRHPMLVLETGKFTNFSKKFSNIRKLLISPRILILSQSGLTPLIQCMR